MYVHGPMGLESGRGRRPIRIPAIKFENDAVESNVWVPQHTERVCVFERLMALMGYGGEASLFASAFSLIVFLLFDQFY